MNINEIVGFGGVALLALIGYIVCVILVPIRDKRPRGGQADERIGG